VESFTDQDLINELLELSPNYPPRHGGVTTKEWAAAKGISARNAWDTLEKWVTQGILTVEYNMTSGCTRPVKVYYKKSE